MPEKIIMIEDQKYDPIDANKENHRKMKKLKKKINRALNHATTQVFMAGILLLSLFLPDSWILGNAPDSQNDALYGVLVAILVIFALEMVVLSFVQDGYFLSFFFWLDLVGTASVIFDIGWITDSFIPDGTSVAQTSIVRATRAAKLGARYGRLLRIMRLMRFIKYLPCFKSLASDNEFEPTMAAIKKVSNDLSNLLSLRTAMLVLIMVIIVPFLSYPVHDYSGNAWIDNAKMIAKNESTTWSDLEYFGTKCEHFFDPKDNLLRKLKIESPWFSDAYLAKYETRDVLRHGNILRLSSSYFVSNTTLVESGNPNALQYLNDAVANGRWSAADNSVEFRVALHLDVTSINQQTAMFNILIILLVLILLIGFSSSYTANVSKLVIEPLEKMMSTLRNSALLMIKSLKVVENAQSEERSGKERDGANADDDEHKQDSGSDTDDLDDEALESAMLEQMVVKLSRIVQHIIPNNAPIATDSNIDKTTANWLNQSYSAGAQVRTLEVGRTESQCMNDEQAVLQRLAVLEKHLPGNVLQELNTWHFDVLKHDTVVLNNVIVYLFSKLNLLDEFKVPEDVFANFLNVISGRYINNTYHNYRHGVDVCFTSYRLILTPSLHTVFSSLEVFSLLVSALAHDVGHPGVNNAFLVNTQHELAIRHNDRSPLENMHCVTLYEILAKQETAIFAQLDKKQKIESRSIILTVILGTDMKHHFEQIQKTQLFMEVNGADTKAYCSGQKDVIDCFREDKHRVFILELILHSSDISNPFKPFDLCSNWANLVVEEFCQQGDKERELGLEISPMCDRNNINLCNMQMGFIEFVVAPLIIAFVNIFPPLHEIGSNMQVNFSRWGDKRKHEIEVDTTMDGPKKAEELRKLDERLSKFADRMSFTQAFRTQPVRKRPSASTAT